MNHWLETQRDILLASIISEDFEQACAVLSPIREYTSQKSVLPEYEQKLLIQILFILKRFHQKLSGSFKSTFENYHTCFRQYLAGLAKHGRKATGWVDEATYFSRLTLSDSQLQAVYQTLVTFQLSTGCSHYCRRCNEWALPGVRSHFSFSAVKTILKHLFRYDNQEFTLYGASDPLDWEGQAADEKKTGGPYPTIEDILEFIAEQGGHPEYGLLTKVPKGKTGLLERLARNNADLSVSMTDKNRMRLTPVFKRLPQLHKQHDFDDLMIPAFHDEDFDSVKPSISDTYGTEITPDGAFIVIPTFTSALNPSGNQKIMITPDTRFFPVRKTGRQALLVDYFKPLEVIGLDGKITHLPHLLPTQVETLLLDNGSDKLNPPGMTNIREFFDIFTPQAAQKRHSLMPAVMKRLESRYLKPDSPVSPTQDSKPLFDRAVEAYNYFSTAQGTVTAKLHALSYLFSSVIDYVEHNPVRARIIRHLCRDYFQRISREMADLDHETSIESVFKSPQINSFKAFEYYKLKLLASPDLGPINSYIQSFPAQFDPVSDRFAAKANTP